jgi:hypothetical protein
MKKRIFFTLVTAVLWFSLASTACKEPAPVPVPTAADWAPASGEAQAPDDIVLVSGGPVYAGNIASANSTGHLPAVNIVQTILIKGLLSAHLSYRAAIESQKPAIRNDIIDVFLTGETISTSRPANAVKSLSFYSVSLPRGVTLTEGRQFPGDLSTDSVLVLHVTEAARTGKHDFKIGVIVNGDDFGALPCALTVTH